MSQPMRWEDLSAATQREYPAEATQREYPAEATQREDPARAAPGADRPHPLPTVQCSLCGIALPTGLMVPDGGQACADIRWYCKDAKSCTERWTASLPRAATVAPIPPIPPIPPAPPAPPTPSGAEPGSGGVAGPVPAELLSSAPEEA